MVSADRESNGVDSPIAVIVLAAGAGTRMKSSVPKVLHEIGGRSLLGHAIAAAEQVLPEHLVVVVRHQRDLVADHVVALAPSVIVADQDDIAGTGRAVQCALAALPDSLTGPVVVTSGDVPLLTGATLAELLADHSKNRNAITMLTARVPDPAGYGRVVLAADGTVAAVVEHRDADPSQREIDEINAGVYVFDAAVLKNALEEVGADNDQGERYLTDVLSITAAQGRRVVAHATADLWQTEGANDRAQLAALGAELNRRVLREWMRAGVSIVDPATTWVDVQVQLAPDVRILPGTQLHGGTVVEAGAVIGPDTTLDGVHVGPRATVVRTHGSHSEIGPNATVGPFAYLRPGTVLSESGKIGTFVETKNASIGVGSKVPHLTYVGDATIGEYSNIGASSVFVNYDGVTKSRTVIGNHCRTGSDTMFVAPVTVGDGAYTGAGTVVRRDVPAGALAISSAAQRNVDRWTLNRRSGTPAARAAEEALSAPPSSVDHDGVSASGVTRGDVQE
ncbi:MAG: bifunctional UDP-N-acetylglucosamine diphosphorylase/glucosamine-1-phosphate N-acetyltransferase GlmU [Actinomycetota bacterium]